MIHFNNYVQQSKLMGREGNHDFTRICGFFLMMDVL